MSTLQEVNDPHAAAMTSAANTLSLMQPWCGKLTHTQVREWAANADGLKYNFFRAVQAATMPLNLTGEGVEPNRMSAQFLEARRFKYAQGRLALVGDSITREVAETLRDMAPHIVVHFWGCERTGLAFNSTLPAQLREGKRIPCKRHRCEFWEAPALFGEKGLVGFWRAIAAYQYDAIFVGGVGMHYLLRTQPKYWPAHDPREPNEWRNMDAVQRYQRDKFRLSNYQWTKAPYHTHLPVVVKQARRLACLSRVLSTPFVYVGTTVADADVLGLDPPKADWGDFFDLSVANTMVAAEQRVEHSHASTRGGVRFLYPSALARACPGARCDGMHFSAAFPEAWSCTNTTYLLQPFIADFLATQLPFLWSTHWVPPPNPSANAVTGEVSTAQNKNRLNRMASCLLPLRHAPISN